MMYSIGQRHISRNSEQLTRLRRLSTMLLTPLGSPHRKELLKSTLTELFLMILIVPKWPWLLETLLGNASSGLSNPFLSKSILLKPRPWLLSLHWNKRRPWNWTELSSKGIINL
ncbi:hypothetical protein CDL12_07375 [Handroanthus impetiginosus]|uniref:Uncharacterized protein n=1 Tax=Handroanthus impetiginosus TaxID=429701 RepID=A0A2G9HQY9_9LAMI|nr:hypothetical protein CDL12_07375 [Handroanthus impetiginosus]